MNGYITYYYYFKILNFLSRMLIVLQKTRRDELGCVWNQLKMVVACTRSTLIDS